MPRPRAPSDMPDADLSLLMSLAGWTFPIDRGDTMFRDTRFLRAPDGTSHRVQRKLGGGISTSRVAFIRC